MPDNISVKTSVAEPELNVKHEKFFIGAGAA
jgi:hypothetical protein